MGKCRYSIVLIIYSKPYETAFLTKTIQEKCRLVRVEEGLGRILADCTSTDINELKELLEKAESWSGEIKLKCPPNIPMLNKPRKTTEVRIIESRLVMITRSPIGCEVKIGPETRKKPRLPVSSRLFYTSSLEELKNRLTFAHVLREKLGLQ
jgi:hypothetical protein